MPRRRNGPESATFEPNIIQPDRFVNETLTTARAQADRYLSEITAYARSTPEKALLSALAGGYVLRMLPLTRILAGLIRLALLLLKPAVLIYGGAKLWQKIQVRQLH